MIRLKKRDDDSRLIFTEPRTGTPIPETLLQMDVNWRLTLGEPLTEIKAEAIEARIMSYLRSQSTPPTRDELLAAVPGKEAAKVAALNHLVANGDVERIGSGTKGNPYRYVVNGGTQQNARTFVVPKGGYQHLPHADAKNEPFLDGGTLVPGVRDEAGTTKVQTALASEDDGFVRDAAKALQATHTPPTQVDGFDTVPAGSTQCPQCGSHLEPTRGPGGLYCCLCHETYRIEQQVDNACDGES
jgi:hypothetical protein